MPDALLAFLRKSLPENLAELLEPQILQLETANFEAILRQPIVRKLVGHVDDEKTKDTLQKDFPVWVDYVFHRIGQILWYRQPPEDGKPEDDPLYPQYQLLIAGIAAAGAFLQSNVTGPVLPFKSAELLLTSDVNSSPPHVAELRKSLVEYLGEDGEAAYRLTPNVELLALADVVMTCPPITKNFPVATWARLRVNFLHQRLLSDPVQSLQQSIYADMDLVHNMLSGADNKDLLTAFLLERATIHMHHGFDKEAREDLALAATERNFEFVLTGLLGKRTKYQERDVSQLVVLAQGAKANDQEMALNTSQAGQGDGVSGPQTLGSTRPETVKLEDDTLLDSISFAKDTPTTRSPNSDAISASLAALDPSAQPQLQPLDSIILLHTASAITNTNPADGLTREETLPYATRVLEGGSSNWQVYTQALLLRSRIEGYKSRTVERGLLQLQALVDQVIADTAPRRDSSVHASAEIDSEQPLPAELETSSQVATSFLPKAKEGESAPASERLEFIYLLCTPFRWMLEAELASRWVSLGGLRSALEIYERLEMWPEAALCYAATDNESKATKIVRRQLFHSTSGAPDAETDADTETWEGSERDPQPQEAPRLWCILGDLQLQPTHYERSWEISHHRYARAMRSLGRYYWAQRDYAKASLSYSKALKVKQIDHSSWFAYGCCLLELKEWRRAVEAFGRAVQIDGEDGEGWSNLAAALLHLDPGEDVGEEAGAPDTQSFDDEEREERVNGKVHDSQKHVRDALRALKQAARLKTTDYRIWSNLLTVAASLVPPSYTDIVTAQSQIIAIRGPIEGEACVDIKILAMLVDHIITTEDGGYDPSKPGLARMTVKMLDEKVVPLITGREELWHLMSKVYLWRKKPSRALEAEEKAWRVVSQRPGWENGSEAQFDTVVEETVGLVDAYGNLGSMERTDGMAAGSGELVEKQWKFKARSAVRGILGRAKSSWEDTKGWEKLQELLEDLR